MCTVTFLPAKINKGYILTSSRDERSWRKEALPPLKYDTFGQAVFYPKDKEAGGTWVAGSLNNFTLCILNGAFIRHESKPPYRKSRGLVLLDFFQCNDIKKFVAEYDFQGIENFTLLILNNNADLKLYELRWDGTDIHLNKKDETKEHIWSSCTLYTDEAIAQRKKWFENFLQADNVRSKENIIHFHKTAGDGNTENAIMMNRNDRVKTLSITSIERSRENFSMYYFDTVKQKSSNLRIFIT